MNIIYFIFNQITRILGVLFLIKKIGIVDSYKILSDIIVKTPKDYEIKFKFRGKHTKLRINSAKTDLAMLTEVYLFRSYSFIPSNEPFTIIDAGSNKGFTAVYLSNLYPNAKIICFEPNANLIPALNENILFNNITATVYQEALSNYDGTTSFEIGENHQYSHLGSAMKKNGNSNNVKVSKLSSKFKPGEIDILKLDVEGEERLIINDEFFKLNISVVAMEIHHNIVDYKDLIRKFESNGYKIKAQKIQHYLLNPIHPYPILIAEKDSYKNSK